MANADDIERPRARRTFLRRLWHIRKDVLLELTAPGANAQKWGDSLADLRAVAG